MSKESYVRGFCKAAEAAGVDPSVLLKYAQGKVTGGRAPDGTASAESGKIPYLGSTGSMYTVDTGDVLQDAAGSGPVIDALRKVPWFKAWHDAHTNSIEKISPPNRYGVLSDTALKILGERYHQLMKQQTNTPPAAVFSPEMRIPFTKATPRYQ